MIADQLEKMQNLFLRDDSLQVVTLDSRPKTQQICLIMGLCYWDEIKDFFETKLKKYFFFRRSPLQKVQSSSSTDLI